MRRSGVQRAELPLRAVALSCTADRGVCGVLSLSSCTVPCSACECLRIVAAAHTPLPCCGLPGAAL